MNFSLQQQQQQQQQRQQQQQQRRRRQDARTNREMTKLTVWKLHHFVGFQSDHVTTFLPSDWLAAKCPGQIYSAWSWREKKFFFWWWCGYHILFSEGGEEQHLPQFT
jgi:hypothetical protein